jgi:hypothetical protein
VASEDRPVVVLAASTGYPEADEALRGFIRECELAFPGRIRCYPLVGSYADRSATAESDLDLGVLFKGGPEPGEQERLEQVVAAYQPRCPLRLDAVALSEEVSLRQATAALKQALVVYGENVVKDAPLGPLAKQLQRAIRGSFQYIWLQRQKAPGLVAPLGYPDPGGEFFGYETWGILQSDETFACGLRTLINSVTLMATALVALEAGEEAPSKGASVELYERLIGDEWAPYLRAVHESCKTTWQYHIPVEPAERAQLHALCARTLAFENAFLDRVRPQVVASLTGEDALAGRLSLECVQRIAYPDPAVEAALRSGAEAGEVGKPQGR